MQLYETLPSCQAATMEIADKYAQTGMTEILAITNTINRSKGLFYKLSITY